MLAPRLMCVSLVLLVTATATADNPQTAPKQKAVQKTAAQLRSEKIEKILADGK